MPQKVEKWKAESGGFFDTEEEAKEAELKHNFKEGFKALEKCKVEGQNRYGNLGSENFVNNVSEFIWRNKEFIQRLFNGEILTLKAEPVKEEKKQ